MESRWIYREVEYEERHSRLPACVYPHTVLSKRLRFDVAEVRDMLNLTCADYVGKAAWYAKRGDSSGADKVNGIRRSMYGVIPYAREKRSSTDGRGGPGMSRGEALMMAFLREEAEKKKAAAAAAAGSSEG